MTAEAPVVTAWEATQDQLFIWVDEDYDFRRVKMGSDWVWVCGLRFIRSAQLTELVLGHEYLHHLASLYALTDPERKLP